MKTEREKSMERPKNSKVPAVDIDPSLDQYALNTPFPEKLALAEERLKGVEIPDVKKHRPSYK